MAHKTLIDGTAYKIIGGKTLVDGTTHEISSGKTLVDGTVHDITFYSHIEDSGTGLEFISAEPFTLSVNSPGWSNTMEYNNGQGWQVWDGSQIRSCRTKKGHCIYIRGVGNTKVAGGYSKRWYLQGSRISCNGNIEKLLNYIDVENDNHPVMSENCYSYMFNACKSLISPPELPATVLAKDCYTRMFQGTCITEAPQLPATSLAPYCYSYMFYGCKDMVYAPHLPATQLSEGCYYSMFYECVNLVNAPSLLPATTLAVSCYYSMFGYCEKLINVPKLPATTLAENCYQYMFNSCKSLISPPELPATTLAKSCYSYMFNNCTSLTKVSKLPAVDLAGWCYNSMFRYCSSIKLSSTKTNTYTKAYSIPCSGIGTNNVQYPLEYMFDGTGGTFKGTPKINTTYYLDESNEII